MISTLIIDAVGNVREAYMQPAEAREPSCERRRRSFPAFRARSRALSTQPTLAATGAGDATTVAPADAQKGAALHEPVPW